MDDAVSLREVTFAYPDRPPVLHIAELRIAAGERVFLHGPSGSGKTTLLSLLTGVLSATSGSVRVLGQDLSRLSPAARDTLRGSSIGYIFQGFNLIPYLSTAENIALPCRLHADRRRRMVSASIAEEVSRLAAMLDITDTLARPVTQLSVGQQQRVAIARAVLGAPSLLIADEPTSALDTERRDAFLALLNTVVQQFQTTLLFVSHDRGLASHFDRSLALGSINRAAQAAA